MRRFPHLTDHTTTSFDEDDLARRQRDHLERVFKHSRALFPRRPCLHNACPQCVGTGIKGDGTPCVHMLSCPCPRCTPYMLSCSVSASASAPWVAGG